MASYGFPQFNPGQLVVGPPPYFIGETTNPLSNNGFRSFSTMPYGCRAWVKNVLTQVNNGLSTYQAFLQAYSQTQPGAAAYNPNYITNICAAANVQPTDSIDTSDTGLTNLFNAQMPYELDAGESVDPADFAAGLALYHGSYIQTMAGALPDTNTLMIAGVIALLVILLIIIL